MLAAPPSLTPFFGKNIAQICPFSLGKDNAKSHCAHFVSHVMEYEFAETCKNLTSIDKQTAGNGAVIRVDTIFNVCPNAGPWDKRPLPLEARLIFVTIASNVSRSGHRYVMGKNH